jgi:flagellar basal-body rod protein FlgF
MDRLIYVAMTGAKHSLEQQATVSNNLANVSTTAFKAQLSAYRAVPVVGPNSATRAFVVDSTVGNDFTPGPLMQTGRPLDVAVNASGWIAVRGADGKEAYTRDGGLTLSPNGVLQTRSGLDVLSDTGTTLVIPQNNTVAIGGDGTVSAIPTDGVPNAVSIIGRMKLVNPPAENLDRGADGLFRQKDGRNAQPDANVQITPGALEGSNVSAVQMLVDMITSARQFDTQMKMLSTAEAADRGWSNVLNLSS